MHIQTHTIAIRWAMETKKFRVHKEQQFTQWRENNGKKERLWEMYAAHIHTTAFTYSHMDH